VESPNTIKHHQFHHAYQAVTAKQVQKARKSVLVRSISEQLAEDRANALADLVKVEIKLSDKFHWFESPVVCRWEPWEESEEFMKLEPVIQEYQINYEKHLEAERQKLFAASEPRQHKKKMRDFDLTNPPEGIDRYVLAKYYLVPMMPEEFKFFHEQLEEFEMKQREWRKILFAKEELKSAESYNEIAKLKSFFERTWKDFEVEDVTIEQFHKFFDTQLSEPRNLFPIKHREMIEAIEDPETLKIINENRQKFRREKLQKEDKDVDIGEPRPLKNEQIALSELLQQIQKVKQSLKPFMWEVELPEVVVEEAAKPTKKKKIRKQRLSLELKKTKQPKASKISTFSSTSSSTVSSRPSSAKSTLSSNTESEEIEEVQTANATMSLIPHVKGRWSTKNIHTSEYDESTQTLTFYAERLGTFGLAVKKFSNLPLKFWEMTPKIESGEKFVIMRISTIYLTFELKVSSIGITFGIESKKGLKMITPKPLSFVKLKTLMTSMNINIFPEVDASWYVSGHSEKHTAMEFHTYKSMAAYCISHHFKSEEFNCLASSRIALLQLKHVAEKEYRTVMVTPLKVASVKVVKQSSELEVLGLDYEKIPADQEVG
jgi:hypothetical protein